MCSISLALCEQLGATVPSLLGCPRAQVVPPGWGRWGWQWWHWDTGQLTPVSSWEQGALGHGHQLCLPTRVPRHFCCSMNGKYPRIIRTWRLGQGCQGDATGWESPPRSRQDISSPPGAGLALLCHPCVLAAPVPDPGGAEGPQNMQVTRAVHPQDTSPCPHGAEGNEPSQGLLLLRFPPRKETRAAISTRWL